MVLKKFNTNNTTVSITQVSRKHWSFQMPSTFFKTRHYEDFPLCHCEEQSDAAIHKKPAFFQPVTLNHPCHPELVSGSHTKSGGMLKQVQHDMVGNKKAGFSLVELLMALLVASLLMAALAPVMTKKFGENVVVSGTGKNTSEHYVVFDDVNKNGTDDNTFTIPSNAINTRVTMIGGGGAGGSATFGSKTITANENNWRIPDGVKKIRVYMIGAGGSGASGGIVLANQLGNLKEGYYEYKDSDPANTAPRNTGGEFRNQR